MLSTRSRAALVAVLGVVTLAVAAPAVQTSTPATDAGGGSGGSDADVESPSLPLGGSADGSVSLLSAVVFALVLFAMAGVVLKNADSTVAAGLGGVVLVALLSGLFSVLSWGGSGGPPDGAATNGTAGTGGAGPGGGAGAFALAPLAALLVGVVAVAGGVVLARRLGGTDAPAGTDDADGGSDGPDPDAVRRVAGRTAERIRSESAADNEVYRCWVEMTALVDAPNPETYTPAEFARAAVDAGMDPGDVDELRRLFEAVRYGGASPEDHERRALSVLERIEATDAADRRNAPGSDGGEGSA